MTTEDLARLLAELIDQEEVTAEYIPILSANTFADAGLLTRDNGVVIKLADGSEYCMSIVRSKRGDND